MKILEIAGNGRVGVGHMGPVTRDVTELANSFARLGHDVTVVDARTDRERNSLNLEAINLLEVDSPTWPNHAKRQSMVQFVSGLSKEMLQKHEIIHVHSWRLGSLIEQLLGIDCVYTAHTPQYWAGPCVTFKSKLKNAIKRAAGAHEYNYMKSCRMTIGLGTFLNHKIKGGNIKIIPNGIDLDRWKRDNDARANLGFGKDLFVLLFVGRLARDKGAQLLIEALRKLENKHLRLVVIGRILDDDYANKLTETARGLPVTFAGFVSNRTNEFLQYLSAANVLVVPSICDNQPNTVLEGLSMGLPIIGSNVGGIPDMLNDEVGLVFESGNVEELAKCITRLYENPPLRKQMSINSRLHVQNNYTWDICAQKHISEFEVSVHAP